MCAIEGFVECNLCSVRKNRWGTGTPLKNQKSTKAISISEYSIFNLLVMCCFAFCLLIE